MVLQDFYVFPVDLYRLGGSADPHLARVRPLRDVTVLERNGVAWVVANNRGISLYTEAGVRQAALTGWAWRIRRGTALPTGLKLHHDAADHYLLCPVVDMGLAEYRGLLERLVVRCERVMKVVGAR